MQLKIRLNFLVARDLIVLISALLAWFAVKSNLIRDLTHDSLVDFLIIGGLAVLVLDRNSHPRFYWFGLASLIISALLSAFSVLSYASLFSSLALGFIVLGVVNQIIFNR